MASVHVRHPNLQGIQRSSLADLKYLFGHVATHSPVFYIKYLLTLDESHVSHLVVVPHSKYVLQFFAASQFLQVLPTAS